MVYSGKPSTGCYLCRRRKIKCDEGRPGCKNCEIYGKQCPGYRPAIVVEDKGYSKWKLLANKNYNNDAAILDPDSAGRLALIPRWLAEASVDDRALCYFFDQYTTKRTPDGLPGVLESIPLLYVLCRESEVAGSPSSCLRWAVEAAALTSFAHETNDQRLDLVARERYVMALRGLNKALSTPMENLQDATLATILLLVIFEDLNGERAELVSSHTAGLELVARLHTSRRLDGRDRCIFDFAIAQLQIQIIGIGGRPQLNLQFLVDLLDQSDPVQSLMVITTKLCQLLVDVPALHDHEEDCRVYSEELTLEDLTGYLLHTQSLDEELSQWCQSVPELWLPRIVYSTTGDTFITYPSISTGSVWNFYRCARIIIRGIIDALTEDIMAMTSMSGNENDSCWLLTSPGQSTHSDIVQNMIVDICRSIPFLLGDVDSSGRPARPNATSTAAAATTPRHSDFSRRLKAIEGYEMLWPFWHVLQSRFSTLKQRMQAQEALRRLDQDFGIRLASKLADISPCSLPRQE